MVAETVACGGRDGKRAGLSSVSIHIDRQDWISDTDLACSSTKRESAMIIEQNFPSWRAGARPASDRVSLLVEHAAPRWVFFYAQSYSFLSI